MSISGHVNIIIFKIKFIPELNTLIWIDFQNKTVNMIILLRGSIILTLTRSKCLVIALLKSHSAVILETRKRKYVTVSTFSSFIWMK